MLFCGARCCTNVAPARSVKENHVNQKALKPLKFQDFFLVLQRRFELRTPCLKGFRFCKERPLSNKQKILYYQWFLAYCNADLRQAPPGLINMIKATLGYRRSRSVAPMLHLYQLLSSAKQSPRTAPLCHSVHRRSSLNTACCVRAYTALPFA